ncbi:SPOR domain-containing protein [Sphingobacterium psychroaquaticum]|uniref:Sporulation related domain-containing protein n=1 Tax=Sphingobacterium psychroaquaticum TaxID=561061 RepID=A0A1X7KGD3_9SPHI|nr:SPOR domain-containing protein [Sphingobacterium psychroaquaticum]SMG40371.1 Sporulation related domain-containing protein [Sphingobacterium psychroaquaticum]
MLRKGLVLFFVCVGVSHFAKAQTGLVEVNKDSLITLLQAFRADNNINPTNTKTVVKLGAAKEAPVEKKVARRVKVRGFRVQIFSGGNRNDASAVQSRFQSVYSDVGSYMTYDEPNYRVKVGDFRNRAEATKFMRELRGQYNNVFVFTEDIWVYVYE